MAAIDRYVVRTCLGAFAMVLVSLTTVIWLTHALREIDLMTNQGQTILVFIGITGMLIPLLVLVIAPIAVVIAVSYGLNKFNSDSEIVVMNASGMSPWRMFRPFLVVALLVAVLVGFISAYLAPKGLRELRDWATKVRADLVTTIVQPGQFRTIEGGLTFHIRERRANGQLMGVFIDDRRSPTERSTFLAEYGEILKNDGAAFLVLVNGSVQRLEAGKRDPTIVLFERYAFDLSHFTGESTAVTYGVRERFLWDLANPNPADPVVKDNPGQFRAEFHDRVVAPLYPIAFVVIAFAVLGAPRTTRQSRGFSMGMTIACVSVLRLIGFACAVLAVNSVLAIVVLYASLAITFVLGGIAIARGTIIEPPAHLTKLHNLITERLTRAAGGQVAGAAQG
jgi:lipopolysaccharide export system permease protein